MSIVGGLDLHRAALLALSRPYSHQRGHPIKVVVADEVRFVEHPVNAERPRPTSTHAKNLPRLSKPRSAIDFRRQTANGQQFRGRYESGS